MTGIKKLTLNFTGAKYWDKDFVVGCFDPTRALLVMQADDIACSYDQYGDVFYKINGINYAPHYTVRASPGLQRFCQTILP